MPSYDRALHALPPGLLVWCRPLTPRNSARLGDQGRLVGRRPLDLRRLALIELPCRTNGPLAKIPRRRRSFVYESCVVLGGSGYRLTAGREARVDFLADSIAFYINSMVGAGCAPICAGLPE